MALPGEMLVCAALAEVRGLMPGLGAAYFWIGHGCEITNCLASKLPCALPEAAPKRPSHPLCEGLSGKSADFVGAVLHANGARIPWAKHVRHGAGSSGMLVVHHMDGRPIARHESQQLDLAVKCLERGLGADRGGHEAVDESEDAGVAAEELIICTATGSVVQGTERSASMLLRATGVEVGPSTYSAARDHARALLRQACELPESASREGPLCMYCKTIWGCFSLSQWRLAGLSTQDRPLFAIQLRHYRSATLRMLDVISARGLSPRQGEIALLIALGSTNAEIADRLNVSVNTVCYHLKLLFDSFGVHSRSELLSHLLHAAWRPSPKEKERHRTDPRNSFDARYPHGQVAALCET